MNKNLFESSLVEDLQFIDTTYKTINELLQKNEPAIQSLQTKIINGLIQIINYQPNISKIYCEIDVRNLPSKTE